MDGKYSVIMARTIQRPDILRVKGIIPLNGACDRCGKRIYDGYAVRARKYDCTIDGTAYICEDCLIG